MWVQRNQRTELYSKTSGEPEDKKVRETVNLQNKRPLKSTAGGHLGENMRTDLLLQREGNVKLEESTWKDLLLSFFLNLHESIIYSANAGFDR